MHPGLASDVLLLAIDSRARYRTRGSVGVVVAAAELCESTLAGQPLPANGPSGSGGRAADLARLLRDAAPTSVQRTAAPLIAAGAIAAYEHRVLGLFPRRGHTVTDTGWHATAEHRLRSALAPGTRLDPGTAGIRGALRGVRHRSGGATAADRPRRAPRDRVTPERAARRRRPRHRGGARRDRGGLRRSDRSDGFVFVGTGHCYGDEGRGRRRSAGDGGDGGGGGGD
jgi:hypothetical protein